MAGRLVSIILPVYNEEECIQSTYKGLKVSLKKISFRFEIIFINDGSEDETELLLNEIVRRDKIVKVIHLGRNYGQTAAMMAGIDHALGDIIVAMDSDGQNDPEDISSLIEKIDEGYDVVSGWRKYRQDKVVSRKIPSIIANWIISSVSGVSLNDYGCSLKAYRADIIKKVRLYGEMHRFIPLYAHWFGARVAEIPVNHFPRLTGVSKYGINRTLKVILDLMVVKFLQKYLSKPIYIIGGFGLICFGLSMLSFIYATYLKFWHGTSYIQTPLLLLSVMATIIGFLSLLIGIVSEVLIRTYYESQGKKPYFIRRIEASGNLD